MLRGDETEEKEKEKEKQKQKQMLREEFDMRCDANEKNNDVIVCVCLFFWGGFFWSSTLLDEWMDG